MKALTWSLLPLTTLNVVIAATQTVVTVLIETASDSVFFRWQRGWRTGSFRYIRSLAA